MMSLRAFVLGVIALSAGVFAVILMGPMVVGGMAASEVSTAYEKAGLDVSDCKKQWVKTTGCLKQPMRQIISKIDNSSPLGAWEDREQREGRAEAPPLD